MPRTSILGSWIHHEELGLPGISFVFLHGNPASSFIWRNVMPTVGAVGRCYAPDLIGMGRSGHPNIAYDFDDHSRYLATWLDELKLDRVVLVGIDWGGALALDWSRQHPERVLGLVLMETILRPLRWSDFPSTARERFEAFRTPGVGERLVLEDNQLLEGALKATVLSGLAVEDRQAYLAPFPNPESRKPVLAWSRQLPIDGEPAGVVARVQAYSEWLERSDDVPKLLLTFSGSPTLMIGPDAADACERAWPRLDIVACGAAAHLAPEDQPKKIAEAVSDWARKRLG